MDLIHSKDKKCKYCGRIGWWFECMPGSTLLGEPIKWYAGCDFCQNMEEIPASKAETIWTIAMSRQRQKI